MRLPELFKNIEAIDSAVNFFKKIIKALQPYIKMFHYIEASDESLKKSADENFQVLAKYREEAIQQILKLNELFIEYLMPKRTKLSLMETFYFYSEVERYLIFSKRISKDGQIEDRPERVAIINQILELWTRSSADLRLLISVPRTQFYFVYLTTFMLRILNDPNVSPDTLAELTRFWVGQHYHSIMPLRYKINNIKQTMNLYGKGLQIALDSAGILLEIPPEIYPIRGGTAILSVLLVLLCFGFVLI